MLDVIFVENFPQPPLNHSTEKEWPPSKEGLNGGGGGPFDGWRLKISRFDGWRLNFRSFDGWRLIFWNNVYNTNLNPNLTVSFNKTICFFSYLNTGFNPIICALKTRLLVFNYGNYVCY